MSALARIRRGLLHVRPFTHSDTSTTTTLAPWTSRSSSTLTADEFIRRSLDQKPADRSNYGDRSTLRDDPHTAQSAPAKTSQRARRQGDHDKPQQDRPKHDFLPRRMPALSRSTADPRTRLVGKQTSDDPQNLAPSTSLSTQVTTPNKPVGTSGERFLARKNYTRPRPTVVTFLDLREDTTIEDVLLSIREAAVAGKIGQGESRILDARIRHARTRNKNAASAMVARVEFRSPFGALRMHEISQRGRFQIRGVVPRTTATLSRGLPKNPFTGTKAGTTVAGGAVGADPPDEKAKKLLDELRVKDKLVRRTHLNYNRELSAAPGGEAQLHADLLFRRVLSSDHHDAASTGHSQFDGTDKPTGEGKIG
ncbi:unnamed protein product [Discula destructiva]